MSALLALVLAAGAIAPDPGFLRDSAQTRNYGLGRPTRIKVLPDGSSVLFLRSGPRDSTLALYEFVVATGETRELVTPAEILRGAEETLSVAERARRERQRITAKGFTDFELSDDGRLVLVTLSGRPHVVDRVSKKVRAIGPENDPILDPQLSPDGRSVAYVKANDLWIADVRTGRERRLTTGGTEELTHGLAEFVAQEEMDRDHGFWWSPDSQQLVFEEADHRGVERFTIADPAHPERTPDAFPYPRAGRKNVDVRLGIVRATGGKPRWIQWNRKAFEYLARVVWQDGAPLTVVVQDRAQEHAAYLAVEPRTGATRTLREERLKGGWLNLDERLPKWLPDGAGLLVASDREEGRALTLVTDRERDLVPAGARFLKLVHVSKEARTLKVLLTPTPTTMQLASVPLEGGPLQVLSKDTDPAERDVVFAKDGSVFVETRTTATDLATSTVYRADGSIAGVLPSVAATPPFTAGVELTSVTANGLAFEAALVRPRAFDPKAKYPVILSVYGGPGVNVVRASQASWLLPQWMADHGAIVVSIDNRGTPRRGRTWEQAIDRNFGDVPLDDQVNALKALGARFPELDLARVGVHGWSFGGYLAALAVLRRPDVFKVGVAVAPVVDWRDYDTHYTERYLDTPEANPAGYAASSLVTYAPKLERPLLVIHGTADDNVYFLHSLKLAEALFMAGRSCELLPLPGTHMVSDPAARERLWERISGFLLRELGAGATGR